MYHSRLLREIFCLRVVGLRRCRDAKLFVYTDRHAMNPDFIDAKRLGHGSATRQSRETVEMFQHISKSRARYGRVRDPLLYGSGSPSQNSQRFWPVTVRGTAKEADIHRTDNTGVREHLHSIGPLRMERLRLSRPSVEGTAQRTSGSLAKRMRVNLGCLPKEKS